MARKFTERYVRYYTPGSAALKVEHSERSAELPRGPQPRKRIPLDVDPFALVGSAVAVLLAILMLVGMLQVHFANTRIRLMQGELTALQREEALLLEEYHSGYDLEDIRAQAESMGMIPVENAIRIPVAVAPEQIELPQQTWFEGLKAALMDFFA